MIKIKHGRTEFKGSSAEIATDISCGVLAIATFISYKTDLSVEECIDKIAKIAKDSSKHVNEDTYKEVIKR